MFLSENLQEKWEPVLEHPICQKSKMLIKEL